jgi:hypothetical protein
VTRAGSPLPARGRIGVDLRQTDNRRDRRILLQIGSCGIPVPDLDTLVAWATVQ